jgi:hypothetical protein
MDEKTQQQEKNAELDNNSPSHNPISISTKI